MVKCCKTRRYRNNKKKKLERKKKEDIGITNDFFSFMFEKVGWTLFPCDLMILGDKS